MYTPIAGTYSAIDSRTMILTLVDILHPIRMDEKDVETIVELNDLFEEMLKDARVISKDLTEGITNTGAAAALAICITIVQILILRGEPLERPHLHRCVGRRVRADTGLRESG